MKRKFCLIILLCVLLTQSSCSIAEKAPLPVSELDLGSPILAALNYHCRLKPHLRYARSLLSDEERVCYDRFAYAALDMRECAYSLGADPSLVHKICGYVMNDFPEVFWFEYIESPGSVRIFKDDDGKVVSTDYLFNYSMTPEERAETQLELSVAAGKCLDQISASANDYEKIKSIYDYIILNTSYSADYHLDQSALGVLLDGYGVCAGYARAAQYLLQRQGIMTAIVAGMAGGGTHMWNIVRCGGEFYHLDTMWGDPVYSGKPAGYVSYAYLLDTTDFVLRTHTINAKYPLPDCTAEAYSYYTVNGTLLEKWDADQMARSVAAAYSRGEHYAQFRFVDSSAYRKYIGGSCSEVISRAKDYGSKFSASSYRRVVNSDELTLELWFY